MVVSIFKKEFNSIEYPELHYMNCAQGIPYGKDHLISCKELNYIKQEDFNLGIFLIEEAKKVLNGFINYVKKQSKKSKH